MLISAMTQDHVVKIQLLRTVEEEVELGQSSISGLANTCRSSGLVNQDPSGTLSPLLLLDRRQINPQGPEMRDNHDLPLFTLLFHPAFSSSCRR